VTGRQALSSAVASLSAHALRSVLTMLGMIFGVGAVIAMLAIGAGAEQEALEGIERLGLRNLIVRSRELRESELREIRTKSLGVSPRDAEAIEEAVPGVELAVGRVRLEPWTVLADGAKTEAEVHGVSSRHDELFHLELAEGRFLDERDERDHAQVCVIGPEVRRALFGYEEALGRDLKVNDLWLTVVGVLAGRSGGAASFEGVSFGSIERVIYLPLGTAVRKLERDPLDAPLAEIVVRLEPGVDPRETETVLRPLLERLHGGQDDFDLVVPAALLAQAKRTQRLFSIVMGCIAGISLLVGGIGIMNIMLATVLERTREIGIRRAVGARQVDIRRQFLFEAFAISLLGGLAGVVLGVGIAELVARSADWPTVVTPWSVILATGVSVGVGLASGLYPAVRAARLDPIDALRTD
jgi:putative ABC transport system permease protein